MTEIMGFSPKAEVAECIDRPGASDVHWLNASTNLRCSAAKLRQADRPGEAVIFDMKVGGLGTPDGVFCGVGGGTKLWTAHELAMGRISVFVRFVFSNLSTFFDSSPIHLKASVPQVVSCCMSALEAWTM